ncbi:hypothetical protein BJ979_002006 [Schumannella luteola]|uniref:Uncharacterized protein n=1 Tax=Schumannella luteola TaxID=472059 RepID=A0A852YDJ4_9MICO|nr:hypothetical protein [Schumannella luteola]
MTRTLAAPAFASPTRTPSPLAGISNPGARL